MPMCWKTRLPLVLLLVLGVSARAAEKGNDYLTRDGKLKERIEVRRLQGGFAGFTGTYFEIEPDGSWSTGAVGPQHKKGEPKARGKLTARQLAGLAKELARQDLAGLRDHGKAPVNPRVLEIRYGNKTVTLQPQRGDATEEEDKSVRARYEGIAKAVEALCKEAKKE
jgi:hypothetical protein